jgi:wyosine [tRNA(Phe)-imidazoG37] synthetase (radical SAM superfamily)
MKGTGRFGVPNQSTTGLTSQELAKQYATPEYVVPKSRAMMILSFELSAEVPSLLVISSSGEPFLTEGLAELVKRSVMLVDIGR